MNRRGRRRAAIVLVTAALMAAVGAFKPFDRRAASAAFSQGVAAARAGDLSGAAEGFSACLAARPGREDCQAAQVLATRAQAAEESARRLAADVEAQRMVARLAVDPSEDDRRQAVKHWNEGIKLFQQNDVAKARDEWLLCSRFDPASEDCKQGLRRIESTYGAGL